MFLKFKIYVYTPFKFSIVNWQKISKHEKYVIVCRLAKKVFQNKPQLKIQLLARNSLYLEATNFVFKI